MLRYHIMTEPEKRQVCAWQYDGEYAAYNLPDYTEMQKQADGLFATLTAGKIFTPIVMTPGWSDSPTCSRKKRRSLSASALPPSCATKGTADRFSLWFGRLPHSFIRTSRSIWRCGAGTAALLPAISVRAFALKENPLSRPPRWASVAFTGWFARAAAADNPPL